MVDKAKENRDLTKGSLTKKLLIYVGLLFLSNALQLLFTTIDLFTVTHFGEGNTSSGAIGATTSLINLLLCVFWGITSGISVVVANAKGAKDVEKVTKAIGSSVLIMLIASVLVVVLGTIFAKDLLIALETDEMFLDKSTDYLLIYFIGAPFNLLYSTGACILRAFGDSKRPFIAVLISGFLNVVLDLFFVIILKMDVKGVALATIAAQSVSMIIVFFYLYKDKRLIANFKFRYLRFYKSETLDILRIGFASGLQSFLFNFTNVFIQKCTNVLGNAAVIGKSAASSIDGYEYTLLNSISSACTVAVSQNFGAKNKTRVNKSLFICTMMQLIIVTLFDGIILLLNKPLLSLFIMGGEETTEAAMQYAFTTLVILGLPYALCGVAENCTAYLRGMKYSLAPTIVSLACIIGLRMAFIWFMFDIPIFHNYEALMILYPISWTLCILVYIPVGKILSKRKLNSFELVNEEAK